MNVEIEKMTKEHLRQIENILEEQFDKFLKIIFSSKRKTLNNNLKARFNSNEISSIFKQFNLLPTIRSEELNPQQIHDIFKFLNKG